MPTSQHAKGLLYTFLGVLALGPDTLIVRLLDIDHWTLLFWRGLLTATGIYLVLLIQYKADATSVIKKCGGQGLLIAFLFTGSTICFISALEYTSVAHTLVIVSASPIFAALLSRVFLGEPIQSRTLLIIVIIMAAISFMVIGDQAQQSSLIGDGLATLTSIFLAASLVLTRRARNIDMTPSMAISGLLTSVVALIAAKSVEIDSQSIILLVFLSLLLTFSFVMLMLGPRYIPAPEVSLMLPIETVTGIALVWWVIGEVPSHQSMVGGLVIISCLMINSMLLLKTPDNSA